MRQPSQSRRFENRRFFTPARTAIVAAAVALWSRAANAAITFTQNSGTNWTVSNGALTMVFDPARSNITSLKVGASNTNVLDPANSQIYDELAKSGLGSGTLTNGFQQGSSGTTKYIDVYTATTSSSTNPFAYQIHYVMFDNDPAIHMYEVVNHSATDIAGSYGQGQFLARVNPTLFPNTYQVNIGPNNQGVQASTLQNYATLSTVSAQGGRAVQDATEDLTGSTLAGDWGTNFYTKYDYSAYEQFNSAHVEYGSQYAFSSILPSHDTMSGGPTKQNLQFTNNIVMSEFLSGHYGTTGYAYTPAQGVDSSRLFGPYVFRVTNVGAESGAQLYQDAVNTIPSATTSYDNEALLQSNGYVPTSQRGSIQFAAASTAGWSTNTVNNTVVLSDQHNDFQKSSLGYQYWTQLSAAGTGSISNIVPGAYRLSLYQLGQWGETRYDGVQVKNGQVAIPQALKFVPENFSSAAPIWTIGTPNRSSNEFLNGHNAAGGDQRQFYGAYNYWKEEAQLGNNGKVVYYATAVGATPATDNPNKWIANQWNKFDPGMYDSVNSSTDNYTNIIAADPQTAYVGNPTTFTGAPWEVHFAVNAAQKAQGQYVVLSIALAGTEASLTASLNGHPETWHSSNASDSMVRSGDAGYFQWLAFQYPVADLSANGADNTLALSVSQTDGDQYDALRMEITNTSADPSVTGWHDYEWITGTNSQVAQDVTKGLSLNEVFTAQVPEPSSVGLALAGSLMVSNRRRRDKRREEVYR